MSTICTVELGDRAYPIHMGSGILASLGAWYTEAGCGSKALIVSDDRVYPLYGDTVRRALAATGVQVAHQVVPAGEASKSHAPLMALYEAGLDAGLERSSAIVALGGGVVGDLAGYAAATFLRGIHLVQIPTTLLAMVDSAVGGKTGINLPRGKNLVGSFHQPSLVVADTGSLQTLALREFCSGMAEVIKYGVIADPTILEVLERKAPEDLLSEDALLQDLVARSCRIKADVVAEDEREGGRRAILNFGHTLGHAIEQVSGYGRYLHGEAISMGMVFAAKVSARIRGFPHEDAERLDHVLRRHRLPVEWPDLPWNDLLAAMMRDKKRVDGVVQFVLADRLGSVQFGCPVDAGILEEIWHDGAK